jgi:hypothetical protein
MAELDDADLYNSTRGNAVWIGKTADERNAALAKAGDYILANYNVRTDLSTTEQQRYNLAKFALASEFLASPPATRSTAAVQKDRKKLDGLEKETIYFEAPSDPYPLVTGLLSPLVVGSPTFTLGRFSR